MSGLGAVLAALAEADQLIEHPESLPAISGVADDSRRVERGTLFCAVVGTAADGHDYVADAAARGAAAALVTRRVDAAIPQVVVRDGRAATGIAAREWYDRPGDALRLIGVTGTNGKTTTVALLRHLLNAAGDAGSIGTVGAFDGAGQALGGYGVLTTPGPVELQRALAELGQRGAAKVVMEASSHALDQGRLESMGFAAAVYTNLSHEHLDYHGDLSNYLAAKLQLSGLLRADGVEVVNADDAAWRELPERPGGRRVMFGTSAGAEVRASDVELDARGARFTLAFGSEALSVETPLLGDFNVANATAAAAAAWALGEAPALIATRLATAPQVSGRMERLPAGAKVVLRDYAHTPDALERALAALASLTSGRLIVLFGAGGDRDRAKRPIMGRIAARGADLAIVTSDNPRTENPDAIIDEIETGMEGAAHERITDRREAIGRALELCGADDVVLLAGKGHEDYQVLGTERLPFDERAIVMELMGWRLDT